jgi:hypothetical protein
MSRPVTVLLSASFLMTAWSQAICERGGTSLIESSRSAGLQSRMAEPFKGQQRSPVPNPFPANSRAGSRAARLPLAGVGTQPKQFLDPTAPQYSTGMFPTSVAVADFNGDGKPDLAVTNSSDMSISVLLANADGTFQTHVEYATADVPLAVVVGDFNGDGRPDLAVANANLPPYPPPLTVLLGNGDGTFQTHVDQVTGNGSISVA